MKRGQCRPIFITIYPSFEPRPPPHPTRDVMNSFFLQDDVRSIDDRQKSRKIHFKQKTIFGIRLMANVHLQTQKRGQLQAHIRCHQKSEYMCDIKITTKRTIRYIVLNILQIFTLGFRFIFHAICYVFNLRRYLFNFF